MTNLEYNEQLRELIDIANEYADKMQEAIALIDRLLTLCDEYEKAIAHYENVISHMSITIANYAELLGVGDE